MGGGGTERAREVKEDVQTLRDRVSEIGGDFAASVSLSHVKRLGVSNPRRFSLAQRPERFNSTRRWPSTRLPHGADL